jgi:acetyl esterase/lipase
MSLLDRLLAKSPGRPDAPPSIDGDMLKVLDAYLALGPKPAETLIVEEARRQPTLAQAARTVAAQRGVDLSQGVRTEEITYPAARDVLAARIYRPDDRPDRPLLAYFRGGGWVLGGLDEYDAGPRAMARQTGAVVVSFDYRSAPEHPFPAAHEDALAAYHWLLSEGSALGDARRIAVMGEGAGGNLACNVAMWARDEGERRPCAMALVTPLAGADLRSESYNECGEVRPLTRSRMEWFLTQLLGDPARAEQEGRINLVEADLHDLPPATVITAELDPLRTDGEILRDRLEASGDRVRGKTYRGVTHGFFGLGPLVRAAGSAQAMVAHDLKRAFAECAAD